MNIFIVLPVFDEEERISKVLKDIKKTGYKTVVVDDGSTDDTLKVIKKLKLPKNKVTILEHKINLGKGAAMKTGAEGAFLLGADAVIFMDSDGQHDTKDLSNFKEKLEEGYDIVFGSRNLNLGVPLIRYLGNKFASTLIAFLFGIYVSDILSGYRALTKKAYKKVLWESRGYGVETEMVVKTAKNDLRSCEVPVTTLYYDNYKGVSILDAISILFSVIRWRLRK